MTQAIPKQVTFDEFIAWYPENSESCYELHDRPEYLFLEDK